MTVLRVTAAASLAALLAALWALVKTPMNCDGIED